MMKEVTDHVGRTIRYSYPPKRIICLVPGITETLFALELKDEMAGRTKYCIFPKDQVDSVPEVGGTKQIQMDAIHAANPDLIITEKEENTPEIVAELEQHYPVFVAEVQTIDEAYDMITEMGMLTDREQQAKTLTDSIQCAFSDLPVNDGQRAAYVIWRKPYMAVGKDTYIDSVLDRLGFVNPIRELEGRYPAVSEEQFQQAGLDIVFLASEPFPFAEKHAAEFQKMLPNSDIRLVDGEMFWYGAKMLEAADYFKKL